jgi:alkylation response protein AidB-like acyl-CoA dehydrogenase
MSVKEFTREEVEKNFNGKDGKPAYLIINGDVLNVTMFASGHPGGELAILEHAGKDATKIFYGLHRHEVLEKRLKKLKVGEVKGYDKKMSPPSWKDISKVPYAEIDMDNSPFWKESHKRFRKVVREWLWDEGVVEWSEQAEMTAEYPTKEMFMKHGKAGMLAMFAGKDTLHRIPNATLLERAGMKPEDFDLFHMTVLTEERARMCTPGAEDGIASGISIGIGPVLHYGQEWMKGELVQSILEGRKVICLAITEPTAGSDVSGISTVARQATVNGEEGFIVRGTKKWITNSMFADYYTTIVKTVSREGKDLGTSMLLIEKCEQVTVRPIPTNYSLAAGTGLISFEDVFVPARNLLGKIGQGFQITMHNFNMERWGICAMVVGRSRRIIEESILWASTRETFGKKLIDHPVIQQHIGTMIAEHQSAYAQFEKLTFQYNTMTKAEANAKLDGPTCLLKFRCTRMSTVVSDLAVQILGGRGVTKTGMGKSVERNMKSFKLASVYGGSEEIMLKRTLTVLTKAMPKNARL